MKTVTEDRHTRRQYVACVISAHWLKLYAHTCFVRRHVIGVACSDVWCVCVCQSVHIQVCVAHP